MWSDDQKKLLRKWSTRIKKEAAEYKYYAIKYSQYYYVSNIIVFSLLGVFGVSGLVGVSVCPDDNPDCLAKTVLDWVNIAFDMLSAITVAVTTFLDFSGHAEKCRSRRAELDALNMTIEDYLTEDVENPTSITNSIRLQYNEIQKKQITLGLGWICMSKKEIMSVHPLDNMREDGGATRKRKDTDELVFENKYRDNKIFRNEEKQYQLERLNDSEV